MRQVRRFYTNRLGSAAIEYCLIGGLISIIAIVAITNIGQKLNNKFLNGISAGLN